MHGGNGNAYTFFVEKYVSVRPFGRMDVDGKTKSKFILKKLVVRRRVDLNGSG
jgi:hypothetical protein